MKALYGSLTVLAALSLSSCSTPKNVTMFQETAHDQIIRLADAQPITVEPGNKLVIIVKSKDPAVSALFNLGNYSVPVENPSGVVAPGELKSYPTMPVASNGMASYTVDSQGDIDFPELGKIHVGGMSRQEIAGFIKGELMGRQLVKDPLVTVEFLNTGISILGSVKTPGRYELNRDNITLTDALALAGDITIAGRRENVKVLRKEGDQVRTYIVDLTNASNTLGSPAYYLHQNDIVYVEPNEMEKRSTTVNGNNTLNVGFWISVASLLTTVATTIGVFVKK